MNLLVLDANPFLRLLLNDIPQQVKEFEKLIEQSKASEVSLCVPQIVIFELNFILEKYYNFQKPDIIKRLTSIVQAPYLQIQDQDIFTNALKIYEENNISLADSFIVAYSNEKEGGVFTFDKKLKKLT